MQLCEFLPWDSDFFGVRIGRVVGHTLDDQQYSEIRNWCEANSIDCLYLLASADHPETVRLAEDHQFRFVDIRITLQRSLAGFSASSGSDPTVGADRIRPVLPPLRVRASCDEDLPALEKIARNSYTISRFYFDPNFPRQKCTEFYETWIRNSHHGFADRVLVAERNGEALAFMTCHLKENGALGDFGLLGVASDAREAGLGTLLTESGMAWFVEQGARNVCLSTQGRNIAAQRLFQRCGFLTQDIHLWYHKWFKT